MRKVLSIFASVTFIASVAFAASPTVYTDLKVTATSELVGVVTMTAAPVITAGKIGFGPTLGSTIYTVEVATTIAANGIYSFTPADGKAGSYTILSGTHSTCGTFTSAGVVSIGAGTADVTPIAVTDAGTYPKVTNGTAITKTMMITIKYVN